jgi:hypothetical protein
MRNDYIIENYGNSKEMFDAIVEKYGKTMSITEFLNITTVKDNEPTKD